MKPLCLTLFAALLLQLISPFQSIAATRYRADAAGIQSALVKQALTSHFPEEYRSFREAYAAAEELYQGGAEREADELFSLAALKGNLLLARIKELEKREPPVAVVAPESNSIRQPVMTLYSSSKPQLPEPSRPELLPEPKPEPAPETAPEPETTAAVPLSPRIVGEAGVYTVKRKESLRLVAARLGVRLRDLAKNNGLKPDATVFAGQRLKYNNRRIIPKKLNDGIVINIPDRSLYLFRNGQVASRYPVAVGISKKGDSIIWRTPQGKFRIIEKKENPTWKIPPSIQKEMEENGEEVLTEIPPGPKNPLGKYAMRTTLPGIMIHSTTKPASINSYSSHGCIRVMPEHMERLFREVTVPIDGEIVYKPVKAVVTSNDRVFLEVNNDSYEQVADLSGEVERVLKNIRAIDKVSWNKVKQVLNEKSGVAVDVTALPD